MKIVLIVTIIKINQFKTCVFYIGVRLTKSKFTVYLLRRTSAESNPSDIRSMFGSKHLTVG